MRRVLVAAVLVVSIGVGARSYIVSRQADSFTLDVATVTHGDIVQDVPASGTLQAVTTVQVGTQVSGTVLALGADFNSIVRKGQVVARLDPSLIDAQIQQAEASLARADADVQNARVQVTDATQKYDRAQALDAKQLVARSDLDAARVAVAVAGAQLKGVEAQRVQAQAALDQSRVNREHTVIAAPIDGIVIERSVDVGQTVAATMSSPTLFTIAADLSEMQLQIQVDEADIGGVQTGQSVTFTVDAYPGETFTGVTTQVRLQPTVVENVTTYLVVARVPNRDLQLKPGMTANTHIETARRDGVVRVPNTALRFRPSAEDLATLGVEQGAQPAARASAGGARVWVNEDGSVRPVVVQVGLSDGQLSEITAGDLAEGATVVTGVRSTTPTATAAPASRFPGL